MQINLTEEQTKLIAIQWIKDQQQEYHGYKQVLDTLLMGAHFAKWRWDIALIYAIKKCAKQYCMTINQILKDIKNA